MKFLTAILSALALALAVSTTSATPIDKRTEPVSFKIKYPKANTVWTSDSQHHVKWDTSQIPPSAVNDTGALFFGRDGTLFPLPIAFGFPLIDGSHLYTVPFVACSHTYFFQLFGGGANSTSSEFTIENSESSC